jgi:hypothetical protein
MSCGVLCNACVWFVALSAGEAAVWNIWQLLAAAGRAFQAGEKCTGNRLGLVLALSVVSASGVAVMLLGARCWFACLPCEDGIMRQSMSGRHCTQRLGVGTYGQRSVCQLPRSSIS